MLTRDTSGFHIPSFSSLRRQTPDIRVEPVEFSDDTHMDELCDLMERNMPAFEAFSSLVGHVAQ